MPLTTSPHLQHAHRAVDKNGTYVDKSITWTVTPTGTVTYSGFSISGSVNVTADAAFGDLDISITGGSGPDPDTCEFTGGAECTIYNSGTASNTTQITCSYVCTINTPATKDDTRNITVDVKQSPASTPALKTESTTVTFNQLGSETNKCVIIDDQLFDDKEEEYSRNVCGPNPPTITVTYPEPCKCQPQTIKNTVLVNATSAPDTTLASANANVTVPGGCGCEPGLQIDLTQTSWVANWTW